MNGRYFCFTVVVRVNQIEVAPGLNLGKDERSENTLENLVAYRAAIAAAISEDGKTYKVLKEANFFPKPGYIECEYDVKGKKTVYIRFNRKIAKGDGGAYGFGALFKEVMVRCFGKF